MIKTILENTSAEIVEKKSKFIANLFYIQSQKEAEDILNKIRKKYHDARHICYAYSIKAEDRIINKMSDDGEPSGTAGAPILNIILKKELVNVLVVVTRYFGGILLGTGGLVKAYSDVTIKAIEKAILVNEENGYEIKIILEYGEWEKFSYYCQKNDIKIAKVQYNDKIESKIQTTKEEKDKILHLKEERILKIEEIQILEEVKIRKNT